jgi:hypothetical protein
MGKAPPGRPTSDAVVGGPIPAPRSGTVGAAAVGFLVGMAPSTRVEDERVGGGADRMNEKASDAGHEALERGREVVREATDSALRPCASAAARRPRSSRPVSAESSEENNASSSPEQPETPSRATLESDDRRGRPPLRQGQPSFDIRVRRAPIDFGRSARAPMRRLRPRAASIARGLMGGMVPLMFLSA